MLQLTGLQIRQGDLTLHTGLHHVQHLQYNMLHLTGLQIRQGDLTFHTGLHHVQHLQHNMLHAFRFDRVIYNTTLLKLYRPSDLPGDLDHSMLNLTGLSIQQGDVTIHIPCVKLQGLYLATNKLQFNLSFKNNEKHFHTLASLAV